jgi:hypothetical protein|tara:strand:+ start:321 stop:530 length:210 start_codon:yes stop_codon:yes gene_type:complete
MIELMKMKKSNICQNTYFDREAKSMRSCVGKTCDGNVSTTMEIFDCNPIAFKKTILETAKSIESYLNNI